MRPHLTAGQRQAACEHVAELRQEAVGVFLFNNLLHQLFFLGGYCLWKKRPDLIRYIWECRNPPGRVAEIWGPELYPTDLDNLCHLFFIELRGGDSSPTWEDNHGSTKWLRRYFLLLLAKYFLVSPPDAPRKVDLMDYKVRLLSMFERWTGRLKQVAEELRDESISDELLGAYGGDAVCKALTATVPQFLDDLKLEAKRCIDHHHRTGKIDPQKIQDFIATFVTAFHERAVVRKIIEQHASIEESFRHNPQGEELPAGDWVDDKECFLTDWFLSFPGWGREYGAYIAEQDELDLLERIGQNCHRDEVESFPGSTDVLGEAPSLICIAGHDALCARLRNAAAFTDVCQAGVKDRFPPEVADHLAGVYRWGDHQIPVYLVHLKTYSDRMLVIRTDRLGRLVQNVPRPGDGPTQARDIFAFRIGAFSEDARLTEEMLEHPPGWLAKEGDREAQISHLQTRVWIRVYQSSEFVDMQEPVGCSFSVLPGPAEREITS